MKKKTIAIAGALLALLCVLVSVLYFQFKPQTTAGEKEISVVVVHANQEEKTFTYQTDAEYLGEVLTENKGGEMVNTSADQTPIADQDQFELTLKEGY